MSSEAGQGTGWVTGAPRYPSFYDQLAANWPDKVTVLGLEEFRHQEELRRASRPPVVNVTVDGMPGHFSAEAGSGQVAWSPGLASEPYA